MTSISSLSGSSQLAQLRESLAAKLDTDGDGKISRDEFVAGRPKDVSESDSAALYAKIDKDGTGALTADQLQAGLEANRPNPTGGSAGLSSDLVAALIDILDKTKTDGTTSRDGASGDATGTPPSSQDLFSTLDSDGDGKVSKAEFLAGRPDGLREDQATSLFDSIDTEQTGSISADQFAAARPQGGPPPARNSASASDGTDSISADTLNALVNAIKAYASANNISLDQPSSVSSIG
ncbi:EF-hand domain-containing protein [Zavarzinia sp.]|uniref:EF-hand domain-containing protein n=1 Tax=Zavarzinia sp. TaxID=2027920 RepID=UPI0035623078